MPRMSQALCPTLCSRSSLCQEPVSGATHTHGASIQTPPREGRRVGELQRHLKRPFVPRWFAQTPCSSGQNSPAFCVLRQEARGVPRDPQVGWVPPPSPLGPASLRMRPGTLQRPPQLLPPLGSFMVNSWGLSV